MRFPFKTYEQQAKEGGYQLITQVHSIAETKEEIFSDYNLEQLVKTFRSLRDCYWVDMHDMHLRVVKSPKVYHDGGLCKQCSEGYDIQIYAKADRI